jgi:hypothetical protein
MVVMPQWGACANAAKGIKQLCVLAHKAVIRQFAADRSIAADVPQIAA